MSGAKRVAKNTSFLTISQFINYAAAAVYTILVARYLGAAGLGVLSFGLALAAIFAILANFGLNTLIAREVARDESQARKYLANIIPIQVLLAVTSIGIIAMLVNAFGYPQQTVYVVYILSIGIIISTLSALFCSLFQAFERLEFQSMTLVITSVLGLCGAVIVIRLHAGVAAFALFSLIASGTGLACLYVICTRRFFVPRLEADFAFWRHSLKEAWPMAAVALSVMIFFRIDVVMISLIQGTTAVGFYSVAYTLSEASLVVPSVFVASIFPVLAKLHQNTTAFRDTCAQAIKYLLYLALPMAFFVTLWAKPLIVLLYGTRFEPSVVALQILIWSAAAMYLSMVLGSAFVAANLQKLSMKLTFLQAALIIGLNVFLIPKYSYFGASIATVVAAACGLALSFFFLGRNGYAFALGRMSLTPFTGLLVIGVMSALLFLRNVPLSLITIINLAIYTTIIYKFGLNEQDKQLIFSLFRRSRRAET